jgi:stage III sporulation protein AC
MILNYSLIFQIAGIGVLAAIISTVLKKAGQDDFATWTILAAFIVVLVQVIIKVGELFDKVKDVFLFR